MECLTRVAQSLFSPSLCRWGVTVGISSCTVEPLSPSLRRWGVTVGVENCTVEPSSPTLCRWGVTVGVENCTVEPSSLNCRRWGVTVGTSSCTAAPSSPNLRRRGVSVGVDNCTVELSAPDWLWLDGTSCAASVQSLVTPTLDTRLSPTTLCDADAMTGNNSEVSLQRSFCVVAGALVAKPSESTVISELRSGGIDVTVELTSPSECCDACPRDGVDCWGCDRDWRHSRFGARGEW